jgi:molecular chaperone DnaJ
MNTHEACSILGIEPGASEDEVTAAFRKKAAKLHPDVNKAENAEDEFKRLNEAQQFLKQHGTTAKWYPGSSHFNFRMDVDNPVENLGDFFQSFFGGGRGATFRYQSQQPTQRQLKGLIQVEFGESVTGIEKPVSYERSVVCTDCGGIGSISQGTSQECSHCSGNGRRKYGAADKELPCRNCKGTGRVQDSVPCNKCIGTGRLRQIENITVSVPAGILAGAHILVAGKGDYLPRYKAYADAVFSVHVVPDRELSREGNDVVSVIDIDLVDALKGCHKKVRTVRGEKTLKIHSGVRHKDTIRVSGFGVPPNGGHLFVVDVKYPQNLKPLIEALENTKEEPEIITGDQHGNGV